MELNNAACAARAAGYAIRSSRSTGFRLLQEPSVIARITELQAATGRARCATVETLLGKLESVFDHAVEDGQFHAAARIVDLQAKLAGFTSTRSATQRAAKDAASPDSKEENPS